MNIQLELNDEKVIKQTKYVAIEINEWIHKLNEHTNR
jgi:hypothetical protein